MAVVGTTCTYASCWCVSICEIACSEAPRCLHSALCHRMSTIDYPEPTLRCRRHAVLKLRDLKRLCYRSTNKEACTTGFLTRSLCVVSNSTYVVHFSRGIVRSRDSASCAIGVTVRKSLRVEWPSPINFPINSLSSALLD